jgi:AraC-like DNA-binding protein
MKEIMHTRAGSFVYTHAFSRVRAHEQFIGENLLAYQISGHTHVITEEGAITMKEGQLILARRDQLAKNTKIPIGNQKCQCVSVILSVDRLQQFALDNGISCEEKYIGRKMILMESNDLLKSYFSSVMSYSDLWNDETEKLATLKVNEIIELLLQMRPELRSFLFDFVDPHKQDLKTFMLRNFRYNVSIEHFAKLSGRSLTGFKRNFAETFNVPPAQWLKNKRLDEAFRLIEKKNLRADDIYHDLGFENLCHFYRAFKQRHGMTPSQVNLKTAHNMEELVAC